MAGELFIPLLGGAIYAIWRIRRDRRAKRRERTGRELGQQLRSSRAAIGAPPTSVVVPSSDAEDLAWRLDAGSTPPGIPAHNLALIEYVDAEGQRSRRRITIRRVRWAGPNEAYLYSYCHERRALRTFLLSRVRSVTDMQTGEVLADPIEYLRDVAPEQDVNPIDRVMRDMEAEVLALVYLARADTRMVANERETIVEYLLAASAGRSVTGEQIDLRVKRMRCEDSEFVESLAVLGKRPHAQRAALFHAATRLIDADGKSHAAEMEILNKLQVVLDLV